MKNMRLITTKLMALFLITVMGLGTSFAGTDFNILQTNVERSVMTAVRDGGRLGDVCLFGDIITLENVKYLVEVEGEEVNPNLGKSGLMCAAFWGRLDIVRYLVEEKGAHVNAKDTNGWTALMYAILKGNQKGRFAVIKYLVWRGAQINVQGDSGISPLSMAAMHGFIGIVKHLVTNNANVNIKDRNNKTPLMFAADGGFYETTKHLVENGAQVSAVDKKGWSALTYASQGNTEKHRKIADYLRSKNTK